MTKHTPGPWAVGDDARGFFRIRNESGHTFVCEMRMHTDQRVPSDARLIAAAPDMLAALTRVSEAHESWAALARPEYGIEFDDPLSDAVKQAREAIAKADPPNA